jgi:riboflavin synthase
MFTGIVEEVGQVRSVESTTNGRRLAINAATVLDGLAPGDSIAVDGVCQTVVSLDDGAFTVESVATTLSRTTLGGLGAGDPVNLERALALGARLGGHFVQGHVDAVGTVLSIVHDGDHVLLDVQVPELVAEVTVLHGSIAIHGVSLTVNALPAENRVQAALIPHTWHNTTLRHLAEGGRVNLEGDMIGRFIAHLVHRRGGGPAAPGRS